MLPHLDIANSKLDGTWTLFCRILLINSFLYGFSFSFFALLEVLNITTKQFHRNCSIFYHVAIVSYSLIIVETIFANILVVNDWDIDPSLHYNISIGRQFLSFLVLLFLPIVTVERFCATRYVTCYEETKRTHIPIILFTIQTVLAWVFTAVVKIVGNSPYILLIYGMLIGLALFALYVNNSHLLKANQKLKANELKPYHLSREYQIKENLTWCKMTKKSTPLVYLTCFFVVSCTAADYALKLTTFYSTTYQNILALVYGYGICLFPLFYGILTLVRLDKWRLKLTKNLMSKLVEYCRTKQQKVEPISISVIADLHSLTHAQPAAPPGNHSDAYFEDVSRQWS